MCGFWASARYAWPTTAWFWQIIGTNKVIFLIRHGANDHDESLNICLLDILGVHWTYYGHTIPHSISKLSFPLNLYGKLTKRGISGDIGAIYWSMLAHRLAVSSYPRVCGQLKWIGRSLELNLEHFGLLRCHISTLRTNIWGHGSVRLPNIG